jgi:hypothetical protein
VITREGGCEHEHLPLDRTRLVGAARERQGCGIHVAGANGVAECPQELEVQLRPGEVEGEVRVGGDRHDRRDRIELRLQRGRVAGRLHLPPIPDGRDGDGCFDGRAREVLSVASRVYPLHCGGVTELRVQESSRSRCGKGDDRKTALHESLKGARGTARSSR